MPRTEIETIRIYVLVFLSYSYDGGGMMVRQLETVLQMIRAHFSTILNLAWRHIVATIIDHPNGKWFVIGLLCNRHNGQQKAVLQK